MENKLFGRNCDGKSRVGGKKKATSVNVTFDWWWNSLKRDRVGTKRPCNRNVPMPMSQKVFTLRAESAKVKRNFMVTMYVVHHGCRVQLVELECQHIAASYSHGASSLSNTLWRRSWFYRPSCHLISQNGGLPAIWQSCVKKRDEVLTRFYLVRVSGNRISKFTRDFIKRGVNPCKKIIVRSLIIDSSSAMFDSASNVMINVVHSNSQGNHANVTININDV